MPPQERVSQDAIVEKAFELTRRDGFERVTARALAEALGCSTQPIFRAFQSMEALKAAVCERTRRFFEERMTAPPSDADTPLFLSMGLTYVNLAQAEPHLFRLLCLSHGYALGSLRDLAAGLPRAGADGAQTIDPNIFMKMWIFTHGIACIVTGNDACLDPGELRALLLEACGDFAHVSLRGKDGEPHEP